MKENKFTVGSLYAGVGGICLGFQRAGFDLSWANEIDKNACITYRENFKHTLIEEDVLSLDIKKLKKIDLLTAGFPCQPFSVAGYRKGFDDHRGNHFYKILDFIDIMRPKVIFLENVKNLVGHDEGNTFKVIQKSIEERNYTFNAKVLNTKDYGNIPHNRERIFIVCFDKNSKYNTNYKFEFPEKQALTKKVKDFIINKKMEEKFYYREDKLFYDKLHSTITNSNTLYQWRRQYVRENKNNLCPTLTANMGTGGHNVPLTLTTNGIRKLTPIECFALQGYPVFEKQYQLPENMANAHLYKQAGNSVSVPIIEAIAKNIMKALKK
jgi:DNA (cytosine-5)-methyltransferase 1